MRWSIRHLLAGGCAVLVLAASCATSAAAPVGAPALEARLYAPCCYGGTLDIHESELARSLRDEIEQRLSHGETADSIQADFVARYGERVLAARSDSPIRAMGVAVALLVVLSGAALALVARRWTRRDPLFEAPSERAVDASADDLDERIDAELADLDS